MTPSSTPSVPAYELNDGNAIPAIGLGTAKLNGDEGVEAVMSALDIGYRFIDTAVNYENETEVGEAVRRSSLMRSQVLIESKIPGRDHAYEDALSSIKGSLSRLGVDQIDVQLIHWPNPSVDKYVEAWKALITAQRDGLIRTAGVSNFTGVHLRRLIEETGIVPAVNQIELHPYFPQAEMRRIHDELGIRTEAWSPIGRGQELLAEPVITDAASAHGVDPAQIVLRWHLDIGTLPLPKSGTSSRQRTNLAVFDFELTDAEIDAITALGRTDGRLFDADPDTHEEM